MASPSTTADRVVAGLASRSTGRRADRAFRILSAAAGCLVLVIIVAIAAFLLSKGLSAIGKDKANFLTTREWSPDSVRPVFGVAVLVYGTLVSALLALLIAVPVAIGVALCLTYYAPRPMARIMGYLIELLAAVPSVVYGLWGVYYLNNPVRSVSKGIDHWLGWIPLLNSRGAYGNSYFLAGIVLAIMVLPIVASLSREVFLQVPRENEEAALALGATRWEMIRLAAFPYAKPGIVAGVMLGLGRALGETIAIAMVLSSAYTINWRILEPGGNTVAANIANRFGESGPLGRNALIASGLVLFIITLAVNMAARWVLARRAAFRETSA
jgi:phosphate transport system permease protein